MHIFYYFLLLLLFILASDSIYTELLFCCLLIIFILHAIISKAKSEQTPKSEVSTWKISTGIHFSPVTCGDIDGIIIMMPMGHDEGFLKAFICTMVWGAACLMASCNLSVDTLLHVPQKPITPLSKAFLQLDMPTFIQVHFGPQQ